MNQGESALTNTPVFVSTAKMQTSPLEMELLHACFLWLPLRQRLPMRVKARLAQSNGKIMLFFDKHPRLFALLDRRIAKAVYRRLTGS